MFEHSVALRVMLGPVMAPRIRYELSRRKEILDSTLRHVDLISMEAANVGSDFAVLVIYPADGLAGGILQWWSRSRETGEAILENCAVREWRCLDQLDFMEGRADRRKYYWAVDKHPNPEGNRRIAEGVVDFLFDGAPRAGRWASPPAEPPRPKLSQRPAADFFCGFPARRARVDPLKVLRFSNGLARGAGSGRSPRANCARQTAGNVASRPPAARAGNPIGMVSAFMSVPAPDAPAATWRRPPPPPRANRP